MSRMKVLTISIQPVVPQGGLCCSPHGFDAVLVKQHGGRFEVRRPVNRHGQYLLAVLRGISADNSSLGQNGKVTLQIRLHSLDDAVRCGADVKAEPHVSWDCIHATGRKGQDARGGKCRVFVCDAVRVGDQLCSEEQGVGPRRERRCTCMRSCISILSTIMDAIEDLRWTRFKGSNRPLPSTSMENHL